MYVCVCVCECVCFKEMISLFRCTCESVANTEFECGTVITCYVAAGAFGFKL